MDFWSACSEAEDTSNVLILPSCLELNLTEGNVDRIIATQSTIAPDFSTSLKFDGFEEQRSCCGGACRLPNLASIARLRRMLRFIVS